MKIIAILRLTCLVVLGLSACSVFGQSKFYRMLKPEAYVVVKLHSMGSNLVEVTFQGSDYPQSAILEKMTRLGKALGNEPRNVVVVPSDQVVKASFAVIGLITDKDPKINIAALASAFGFGERPIRSFSVFFVNATPGENIVQQWTDPNGAWKMEGFSMASPKGLDYRVQVNTNNPNEIYMPDSKNVMPPSGKPESIKGPNNFIIGGIVIGAIAVGLLVYSALLRPRKTGR